MYPASSVCSSLLILCSFPLDPGYPILEIGLLRKQPGLPQAQQYEGEEEEEAYEHEGEAEPQGLRKSFEDESAGSEGGGDVDSGRGDFYPSSSSSSQAAAVQYIG